MAHGDSATMIVTYTISIDDNGNIYNDVQTHGNTFAKVYKAFLTIKDEVLRQIKERGNCPFNPKLIRENGEPEFETEPQ